MSHTTPPVASCSPHLVDCLEHLLPPNTSFTFPDFSLCLLWVLPLRTTSWCILSPSSFRTTVPSPRSSPWSSSHPAYPPVVLGHPGLLPWGGCLHLLFPAKLQTKSFPEPCMSSALHRPRVQVACSLPAHHLTSLLANFSTSHPCRGLG